MSALRQSFRPSVMLTEILFPYQSRAGIFADFVERIGEQTFYRSVEIREVDSPAERKRIARATESYDLTVSMWMSAFLIEQGLNIASLDTEHRRKSVELLKDQLPYAAECRASRFAMIPGPDPGILLREDAVESLYSSLCELCAAAGKYESIAVTLEPLDRGFDKNGVVGPTSEFVTLVERVQSSYPNMYVNWDSAHVALCGDDVRGSLSSSRHVLNGIHLANAILDRDDPLSGDKHMPAGGSGFLTVEFVADLFVQAAALGLFARAPLVPIAVEIRAREGDDPWSVERLGREFLCSAWDLSGIE